MRLKLISKWLMIRKSEEYIMNVSLLVHFPKIFRFITEKSLLLVIGLVSLVVLTAIILEGVKLQNTLQQADLAKEERIKLTKELAYWQSVTRQYNNYRDAYFKVAILQYQLGEMFQAKETLNKVVALDPNFENAHILSARIEAQK